MKKLREQFQGENQENTSSWRDEMSSDFKESCPTMSYEHRLYGCCICFGIGLLLSLLSTFCLAFMKLTMFAVYYTFGSICGLFSTAFLVGICRQCSVMFSSYRWITTIVYLFAIIATLFFGLYPNLTVRVPIVLLCILIQYCAGFWYVLSFIPFARAAVEKFIYTIV